jgi:hypothetical protein
MGLRCIIQYSHHPAIPSKDSPTNYQCPMVCNKSYLTQRLTYPTSPYCPTGTNRNLSHGTAISTKPTHGTNTHSARQQAIAKVCFVFQKFFLQYLLKNSIRTDHKTFLTHLGFVVPRIFDHLNKTPN